MSNSERIRVLIAKCGLDGHDRGAKVVALGLRDEGMEVVYTNLRQTPQAVAQIAIQEDVDVVGLSCLSGAHRYLFPALMKELDKAGVEDVLVIGGGTIPDEDIQFLNEIGVRAIFGPGSPIKDIASYIKENIRQ